MGTPTASQHNIFDSEKDSQIVLVLFTGVRTRVIDFMKSWVRRSTSWTTPHPTNSKTETCFCTLLACMIQYHFISADSSRPIVLKAAEGIECSFRVADRFSHAEAAEEGYCRRPIYIERGVYIALLSITETLAALVYSSDFPDSLDGRVYNDCHFWYEIVVSALGVSEYLRSVGKADVTTA